MNDLKLVRVWDRNYTLLGQQFVRWKHRYVTDWIAND